PLRRPERLSCRELRKKPALRLPWEPLQPPRESPRLAREWLRPALPAPLAVMPMEVGRLRPPGGSVV
ncbi:MAG: hypothetical protein ACRETD_07540, partial [Steroidobacteraceae bacterium]